MITVSVPATSANIGAGFDSCGLALALYNRVQMEEWDGVCITSLDGTRVPAGPQNLVYRTAKGLYDECGAPLRGLRLAQENGVPMARGLGSSSACIAAGLVGANELFGTSVHPHAAFERAAALEGHPDNVAPAMLGGFVASALEGGRLYAVQKPVSQALCFAAFVPGYKLLTKKARARCPVGGAQGRCLQRLTRGAAGGGLLRREVRPSSRGHGRQAAPAVPRGADARHARGVCAVRGAGCAWLVGKRRGAHAFAAVRAQNETFFTAARAKLAAAERGSPLAAYTLHRLAPDNAGARATA